LLAELERALGYPKLRQRISSAEHRAALVSGDEDLRALSAEHRAALVSGDEDLLALSAELPIHSPPAFASLIEGS